MGGCCGKKKSKVNEATDTGTVKIEVGGKADEKITANLPPIDTTSSPGDSNPASGQAAALVEPKEEINETTIKPKSLVSSLNSIEKNESNLSVASGTDSAISRIESSKVDNDMSIGAAGSKMSKVAESSTGSKLDSNAISSIASTFGILNYFLFFFNLLARTN